MEPFHRRGQPAVWPLARVERWIVRAGLFVLPLAYWPDTYDHYVLPKLLVARTLVIVLAILFVARVAFTRTLVVKRSPLDLPWVAFIGSALLSTLFAANQNVAVFGVYSRYDGTLTILTYAGLFWLSRQTIAGPDDARSLLRVLLASGYVVAAVAIIQSLTDSLAQGLFVPSFGTLGNPNMLGAYLAMLCPLAWKEIADARSWGPRILAANALAVIGLALLLTFSRSAWLGVTVAAVVLAVGERSVASRFGLAAGLLLVRVAIIVVGSTLVGGLSLEAEAQARANSAFDLGSWQSSRLHIWLDSLRLIASRPVAGYGPDNFGLVFPRFETGDWAPGFGGVGQQIDKAHAETLQVAATQGIVGLAAYVFMLAAFVRAFWRGRSNRGAVAVFAAWLAYEVTLQLNFSAPAAALPFWIFAAAAVAIWTPEAAGTSISLRLLPRLPRLVTGLGAAIIVPLAALAWFGIAVPYLADARLLSAVNADFGGRSGEAQTLAAQARQLGPRESVYAVEVGNIAFEHQDWPAAREAYADAASLGTYNPMVYRNLALADQRLGNTAEALVAARKAVELDRFDPANRALLAQFRESSP